MKYLIRGAKIVDARGSRDGELLISEGVISELGEALSAEGTEVIEAEGKMVLPGLIDMHVHLREPGFEEKETIATGTRSAARGGFTTIAAMPNTNPVVDHPAQVEYVKSRAAQAGSARVLPIGAISRGLEGKELAEIGMMKEAGIVAISDDGHPVEDSNLMRRAMEYAANHDLTLISHCEDLSLKAEGVVHEGYYGIMSGLRTSPAQAESVMVARDLLLAERTGVHLHLAHISTAESLRLIRQAKRQGVRVTAEVTPHHLTLTDECITSYDTCYKMNPPLRSKEDVEALKEGLAEGTIDVIATDHAPHTIEEKAVEFDLAPDGIIGLETALPLVITELVERDLLSLEQALEKLTLNPARILGLKEKPLLKEGQRADLTIIDLEEEEIKASDFLSKAQNSPFTGSILKGRVLYTMLAGERVFARKEWN